VFSFIYGYSNLRYEFLNWRLIVWGSIASAFSVLFATKTDWIDVSFDRREGYVTTVYNSTFWTLFALSILLVDIIEVIIPLINAYVNSKINRLPLLIMIFGIILALFSNILEPILRDLDTPQAIRFLIADVGFLIFFSILLKYPFTGLYDQSQIEQVIVSDKNGIPKSLLSRNTDRAVLASGAIIGINSILEEIAATNIEDKLSSSSEITRKIELGAHQFFIILRGDVIIIFQFSNPSGVCFSKFKSLGRIFSPHITGSSQEKRELETFETRVREYFSSFSIRQEEGKL
jgi:hypothetical protein